MWGGGGGILLAAENIIRLRFSVGSPELFLEIDFVIVDELPYSCIVGINLPYSCIVGINLLNTLTNWGVNNNSSTLDLNSSAVNLFSEPEYNNQVNLIIREKLILLPGETKIIKTLAVGPTVEANRPITSSTFFTERNSDYEGRTCVRVYPCLKLYWPRK